MRAGVAAVVAVAVLAAAPAAHGAEAGDLPPKFRFFADRGETNDFVAVDLGDVIYAGDYAPNVVRPFQCHRVWRKGRKILNEVKCDQLGTYRASVLLEDGDDRVKIAGFKGSDMSGGPGNDRIHGGGGDDHLNGGEGNDRIYGRGSNSVDRFIDELDGGPGDDVIDARGGRLRDLVLCGDGLDTVKADRRDRVGKTCERVFRAKG